MSSLEELKRKRALLNNKDRAILNNMDMIIQENYRVADIAHNASLILDDLDKEFENKTRLNRVDINFLFFATALQTLRWVLSPSLGETIDKNTRIDDKEGDELVNKNKKDYLNNHQNWEKNLNKSSKEYKTWKEIIFSGVPYDATKGASNFGINMEGRYHRYKTLGHDPLLGWIFGTVNIISETTTLNNFRTYEIENMHFTKETNIFNAFGISLDSIVEDIHRLPAAVFRQGLHLKSDQYTKLGLQVPILGMFSEELAGKLYRNQYDSLCLSKDLKNVGKSAMYAILINMIISLIHGLFYDDSKYENRDIYEVKTRKILSYSNAIASASNVIYVAINAYLGNGSALKKLDIGGIIVTLYRLINDFNFIRKVKEEFVFGNFDKLIQGEDYIFEEVRYMDLERFAKKKLIPFYNTKDWITKIQDYGFVEGVKEKLKEDFIEDMPIIGNIYDLGRREGWYNGKKEGYSHGLNESEKKIIKQTEEFLKQKELLINNSIEKNELLDKYEKYIQEMENKHDSLTIEQSIFLNKVKVMKNKLIDYKALDLFIEDDGKKMLSIIENQFTKLKMQYSLTKEEISVSIEALGEKLSDSTLKDMVDSPNKINYAYELIFGIIEPIIKKREYSNNIINENISKYDERGFEKNTVMHKNGTKFDDYGYSKYGYDKDGNRINITKHNGEDVESKSTHCDLIKNESDNYNNDKELDSSKYDERGFIKYTVMHKNGTKYDDYGFNKYGYDKDEYDKNGFKFDGYHRNGTKYSNEGFDKHGYDKAGYNIIDFKSDGYHRNGTKYDNDGFDNCGHDKQYYLNIKNDERIKNDIESVPSKYDERGFIKHTAMHKNGTKYDDQGFDKYGYDKDMNHY